VPYAVDDQMGLANRFLVTANPGSWELGSWAEVKGIDVTWDIPEYRAGDSWNLRWQFPALTKYSPVTLSRAATKKDTQKVKEWLNTNAMNFEVGEVTIKLLDAQGEEVADWTLKGAVAAKWSIAGFDANSARVAIETLTINHIGFLDDERTF